MAVSTVAAALVLLPAAPARAADALIAAAGDIACDPNPPNPDACQQQVTSDLLVGRPLAAVLMLGDSAYNDGTLAEHQAFYDPSWGRFKSITYPAIGNHEYHTVDGQGYFQYFGAAAGDPRRGWYSIDIGDWHVIALNSNCFKLGGCGPETEQVQWLKADLAAHQRSCTLAFWHHPHFSSGPGYDDNSGRNPTGAFWKELYAAGADLVLNGHDHGYERFGLQDPEGEPDAGYGMREFVVGTGGKSYSYFPTLSLNSEVREGTTYGVLELTLRRTSFDWRFVPVPGKTFTDSGAGRCHGAPGAPLLKMSRLSRRLSRTGSYRVRLSCTAVCKTRTRVTVTLGRRTRKDPIRKVRSRTRIRTLMPELRSSVRVKFSKSSLRAIRRAFRRHTRLTADVKTRASVTGLEKFGSRSARISLRR